MTKIFKVVFVIPSRNGDGTQVPIGKDFKSLNAALKELVKANQSRAYRWPVDRVYEARYDSYGNYTGGYIHHVMPASGRVREVGEMDYFQRRDVGFPHSLGGE